MYRMTQGPQPGVGTQLVERFDGMGDYVGTSTYGMTPAGQAGIRGLACAGTPGCSCGMGLFDTGFSDVANWGLPEWAVTIGGAYVVWSILFTSRRAASAVRRAPTAARRKAKAVRKALKA